EAQTLKNIKHPAIPNYLDYFELNLPDCKGFALVQEYIAAPSLEEAVKLGRKFSESEIQEIATALLNILTYLHQQQPSIIHRDIKPSNILLTDRSGNSVGQVYLIDFGAVKSVASSEGGTITVVGTYGYMPPEQFGGHTTPASDLFSLGATLIYLATGRHPTELPSKDGKIDFAKSVRLNHSLVRWLEQIIEPSCERRFKTATEALQALKHPIVIEEKIRLKQPKYSHLKLDKTKEAIEVMFPAKGFTPEILFIGLFALFWNGFMIAWTGIGIAVSMPTNMSIMMHLFSIPFWLIGFGLIGSVIFTLLGKTQLQIDSEQISLTYSCLGIKYQTPQAANRGDIEVIECDTTGWQIEKNGKKVEIVSRITLWANGKAYNLKPTVKQPSNMANRMTNYNPASVELNWLAQELSEWLRLPITRG
ncbi:MAG: serine/threonine-protein kinase, partial [Cyanobacteria bacterium J06600_6]